MLNLLRNYVDALFDDPVLLRPDMRQLAVAQLCDLVAITLGATRDAAALAEGRGIRAARLRAIKSDIEAHLGHDDLSPGAVARRQKVSDSYIRKLFEGEGTSFSQFVLNRRLVRAHLDAHGIWRRADRGIAGIAFEPASLATCRISNTKVSSAFTARPHPTFDRQSIAETSEQISVRGAQRPSGACGNSAQLVFREASVHRGAEGVCVRHFQPLDFIPIIG